nr:retrovirus-related Pol polyprotein from transposon TNT 1-94 [Tanacetum cinerariifolium]
MRPFGCSVTILNTLDPLGKFEGKVDEGFLVGYSVNSKSFRVFNSRTRIVQETLHVNFLENKPNIAGKFEGKVDEGFLVGYSVNSKSFRVFNSRTRIVQETLHVNFLENKPNIAGNGPTWLFDMDSLTKTMNYQPVIAGNQSNPSAGFQDEFDAEKAGEEAKRKSYVESFTGNKDLSAEFEDHYDNSCNDVNAAAISPIPTTRIHKDHPISQIIGDHSSTTQIRKESKRVHQALKDLSWIEAMQEELLQFKEGEG